MRNFSFMLPLQSKTTPTVIGWSVRLNETIGAVMSLPDVQAHLAADGAEAVPPHSPDKFRAVIANEIKRWGPFIKRANLKLE